VLHRKLQSVGAQKAVMISNAPYQRGALAYAREHGIALATVIEGRFAFETRAAGPSSVASRQQAEALGLPALVGHAYLPGAARRSIRVDTLSPRRPGRVAEALFGIER
jgi:hypothetical protein